MATRQDVLFAAEDYIAKYQSFAQSNFQAYDFDTLKAAMVDYIRLNYPEDYNDWIQSSEFISLMDLENGFILVNFTVSIFVFISFYRFIIFRF